jgi:ubiquinone/menaquinone biosynthesis C-methylase UbiE
MPADDRDQHQHYEEAYATADNEWGFPDSMIVDGKPLNGRRILSLGCGAGSDVWFLASDNLVVGIDYVRSGLAVAARHGLRATQMDLNAAHTLPFPDEVFDVVVCKDILEHLVDPRRALEEIRRVLRRDGYVVLNVPNHFYLTMRLRILTGKGLMWKTIGADHTAVYDESNYMHLRFYTYRGLLRLLSSVGLHVDKWFWDLGTLAYYNNPDRWLAPQLWKKAHGVLLSRRGSLGVKYLLPLWNVLNVIFPRRLRAVLVSVAPGLFCASFYCHLSRAEARRSGRGEVGSTPWG